VKKVLIALGALIVLVIAAALAAPFLIPTDTYKARLIALVKDSTGRDLKIAGPVKFSLLPELEIEAGDVSFANAPGAHFPDMMRLKKLEVRLRVLPLLHGAIEVGSFVLTSPQIALEIDKSGKPNWVFAPAAPPPARAGTAPPAAPSAAGGNPAGALSELRLDDVRLVDGSVSYRDDRATTAEQLDAIDMKLSLPSLDSPFAADGSAVWHAEKIALTVAIAKPRALISGTEGGFQIKLAATPVSFNFAGTATGLPPSKLGGTVDLAIPSVRGLAKWAGAPLPPGPVPEKIAIKGRIDMAGPKMSFSDADIAIDAITAKGSLAVDTGGQRPALTGTLAIAKLDVNPYLPPPPAAGAPASPAGVPGAAPGKAAPPAAAAAGWSDAPIDTSALAMADGDFDLTAGAIVYRKIEIGQSALDVHLKGGKLTANLSKLSLYQGQGQGKVALDGSGATPALAMTFALSGVQVEPLLAAAAGMDKVSGTGKLNIDVTGTGKSQRALIATLGGKGAVDLANGQIKGVNLIGLAANLTAPVTGANSDARTDFGSLTGTFTIAKGIVKNDDLKLESGLVPVTGNGTVDLPDRTVDYHVTVSPAGAIGVPIAVTGPWDNLSYRPDLGAALQGAAKSPGAVLNQLRNLGGNAAGAGGNVGSGAMDKLKGLFGK